MLTGGIEVELKFILSQKEEAILLDGAQFIGAYEFVDVYYDTCAYDLSRRGLFLRTRDGHFTLKCPQKHTNALLKKQKNAPQKEITDVAEICRLLALPDGENIHDVLTKVGILPLYMFKNVRRKYQKNGITIDLDKAIFDDFTYETCEIELVVQQTHAVLLAIETLTKFAHQHGLQVNHVEGRLIEYLRRKKPDHYHVLKSTKL